jgi:hypothetical protein
MLAVQVDQAETLTTNKRTYLETLLNPKTQATPKTQTRLQNALALSTSLETVSTQEELLQTLELLEATPTTKVINSVATDKLQTY